MTTPNTAAAPAVAAPAPVVAAAPALPAAPDPTAPPHVHASWVHSLFAAIEAALASPVGAQVVASLPPKFQIAAVGIQAGAEVGDQLTK